MMRGGRQDARREVRMKHFVLHSTLLEIQVSMRYQGTTSETSRILTAFTHQSDVRSGWRIFESGFVRADAASDRECHRESECHVLDCSIRSLRSGIKDPWKCDTRQNPILGTGCLLTKSECFSGWLSLIAHFCMFRDLLFFKSHSLVPVRCRV